MKVAVVGCLHGELDIIYQRIADLEQRDNIVVDLLIVCGDFQTIRNENDLKCMAVPNKYKRLGTFHNYYFGRKRASKLTILVGGNHEASNYLQTLPYGGWVAPNMYFLGLCSVIQYAGLRIGGISGIFKFHHAKLSHFESLPYNDDTMRSIYHMRETEVYKLLQITAKLRKAPAPESQVSENDSTDAKAASVPLRKSGLLDVFISHDWPLNIHQCGNINYLLSKKPFFKDEVNSGRLGNPLLQPLVHHIRPKHWFAAHLHVGFRATVNHPPNPEHEATSSEHCTHFQALDKVVGHRNFLQVFDIFPEEETSDNKLQYDPEWLAILKKTDHLLKIDRQQVRGIDIFNDQNRVQISDKDIEDIYTVFNNDLTIPDNFAPCEPVPTEGVDNDPDRLSNFVNPQTAKLCELLGIEDLNQLALYANPMPIQEDQIVENAPPNPDAIDIDGSDSDEEGGCYGESKDEAPPLFVIDTVGNKRQKFE